MGKYMVLYNSLTSASDQMASASQEEMYASMNEWIKWRDEANKTVSVDFGLPLQAVGRINNGEVIVSESNVSGYTIIEGDSKDTIFELLLTHPHLKNPENSIDIYEMLPMPGM